MKGLSRAQLTLLTLVALALLVALIAVVVEAWRFAAAAAVISFGLFVVLVVLTLTALTRSVQRQSELLRDSAVRTRETVSGIRRIDQRTEERFMTLDSMAARMEAAERRLLAAFEAHRHHIEDTVAQDAVVQDAVVQDMEHRRQH